MKNKKLFGAISALLSGVLYGIIPLVLLNISRSGIASSVLCNMYRQFSGAAILLPFAIWRIIKLRMPPKQFGRLFGVALFSGIQTLLLYQSFDMLPTGIAIMLHYLYPVFTLILSVIVLKQKPSRRAILAVVLAFVGVVFLCDLAMMPERPWLGVLIAVLSGFFCGVWLMLVEKLKVGETDKTVYTCTIMLGAGIMIFLYLAVRGQLAAPFTGGQWGSLVLSGVFTLAAVTFLAQGIRYAGSVISAVLSTLEPIVCSLGSALVLGDAVTGRMLLGSVLVLGAVFLLTVKTGTGH